MAGRVIETGWAGASAAAVAKSSMHRSMDRKEATRGHWCRHCPFCRNRKGVLVEDVVVGRPGDRAQYIRYVGDLRDGKEVEQTLEVGV